MKQYQYHYEYLYQMLTSQFFSGAFLQGQKFLSQRELCLQYNVGITTVRRVMKTLEEQGYIRTVQGQPSVVTYPASKEACAAFLVQRQDEIADAYQGLELLMPVLYCEGAKRCSDLELRFFQEVVDGISENMELPDLYRQANAFFATLLRPLNNPLILDLELDIENYLHVPYIPFPGVENPFALTADRLKTWLKNSIIQIEQKQFGALYDGAVRIFQTSGKRVDDYFCALSRYDKGMPQTKGDVNWFRIKGRSELYARLAMVLVRRIVNGEFDREKYLPSIPKLMEEYGVMKDTASRAVQLLNFLGFVQTIHKKGSVLASQEPSRMKGALNLAEPVIQARLQLFLNALQIVTLTARNCAASFPSVPKEFVLSMEGRLQTAPKNKISPLSFQLLMNCFTQLIPHQSLKNIFQQLDNLLIWGYYLQTVDEALYPDYSRMAAAMKAIVAALKNPNHVNLPDAFGKAFSLIYQNVCEVMSQIPIHFKSSFDL